MSAPTDRQPQLQADGHNGYRVAVAPGMTRFARGDDPLQPLVPQTPLQAFHLARVNATVYGTWQICWFKRCRRKKKCLGGPRGTFGRFGKPLCEVNGDSGV